MRNNRLRQEYLSIAAHVEQCTVEARELFIQNRLFDALENNKNVWKELRGLGLLPRAREELHGFFPDELNKYFAGVSVSDTERNTNLDDILSEACEDGFTSK